MGFLSRLFGGDQTTPPSKNANGLINDISGMVDNLFTSDEERKLLHFKLEQLAACNPHPFVAGGRSAIMWCLGLVVLYNVAIREIIILCLGIKNPPEPLFDIQLFITHIFKLISGTL